MSIYCLEDFKVEFEKLISKNAYRSLQQDIIDYFFEKSIEDLCSGTRLNLDSDSPYIKKRIKGRGGFRCYFLLIIKQENVYLMFVHPKTGNQGSSNITDETKAYLYKKIVDCIHTNDLYEVEIDEARKNLAFKKKVKSIV